MVDLGEVGARGSDAEPLVPVDRRGDVGGALRTIVDLPPPHRPRLPGVNFLHLPDRAVMNELDGRPVGRMRLDLIPHLRHDLEALGRLAHLPGLEDGVREWLLALDVLAEMHRRQAGAGMHVIGGGNDDGIEKLRLVEKPAPIGQPLRLRKLFSRLPEVGHRVVDVAQRRHLGPFRRGGIEQVAPPLAATADRGDADFFIRAVSPRPRRGRHPHGDAGGEATFEERTAGEGGTTGGTHGEPRGQGTGGGTAGWTVSRGEADRDARASDRPPISPPRRDTLSRG